MKNNRFVAIALAFTLANTAVPIGLLAQQSTSLAGTAKDEAKKPFTDYTVRARDVTAGTIADDRRPSGWPGRTSRSRGLSTANYIVELVNKNGKVVCTEGPFDLSKQAIKSDVIVDCNKAGVAATGRLLAAAARPASRPVRWLRRAARPAPLCASGSPPAKHRPRRSSVIHPARLRTPVRRRVVFVQSTLLPPTGFYEFPSA